MTLTSDSGFALELNGYSVKLPGGRLAPALPFDLRVGVGEVVALSGPIGTGKSLILRGLVGLLPAPLEVVGSVTQGQSVDRTQGSAEIALVPQDPRWSVLPSDTIRSLVRESTRAARLSLSLPDGGQAPSPRRSAESIFPELFLDLDRLQHLPFHALSSSEKTRVLLCLALSNPGAVLAYDGLGEVLSPIEERRVLSLLFREAEAGRSVLIATRLAARELPPGIRVALLNPGAQVSAPLPLVRRSIKTLPPPAAKQLATRPALELRNVSVLVAAAEPNKPRLVAASNLSLAVRPGGSLGLLGPPGSGKTALLESIVGIRSQRVGQIFLGGVPLPRRAAARPRRLRRALQLVVEQPRETLDPDRTVRAELEAFSRSAETAHDDPESWLERLRLPTRLLDLTPDALSEGEVARVVLARCLALSPDVLLLDEPRRLGLLSDGLSSDGLSRDDAALLAVLQAERERGMAIVFTSSDPTTASLLADEIGVLHAGMLVERGPTSSVLNGPLHPLTQELLVGPRPPAFDLAQRERGCAWVRTCPRRQLDPCAVRVPLLALHGAPEGRREVACHYPLVSEEAPVPELGT